MNVFNYVKERVAIADVVREYVALKPVGVYLKGSCPFHSERTASFTVSPHKEIFYCFGCHATGDVISFIAQIEHCGQLEAAKLLADKFNVEIPAHLLDSHKTEDTDEKTRYWQLCQALMLWCAQQLKKSDVALHYVQARQLLPATVEAFKIGYFPPGAAAVRQLCAWLQPQGFLVHDLARYHIICQRGIEWYSPFEDRIMFPIADHLGRWCGFGGRVFKSGDERAKYYNTKENAYFSKGALLFGLDRAKKGIQDRGTVFLVEGYMDCLAMAQAGFDHTVATLGTACTAEHLKIIARYVDRVYVLYDGDQAGIKAMLRLTELCWNANLDIKVVCLPAGDDPASFLGAGKSLEVFISQALDIFTFFITQTSASFDDLPLKKKVGVAHAILEVIGTVGDPLKKDLLLQQAAHALHIPLNTLRVESRKNGYGAPSSEPKPVANQAEPVGELEKQLFCLLIEQPELLERADVQLLITALPETLHAIILKRGLQAQHSFGDFALMLGDDERQLTYRMVMAHDKQQERSGDQLIKDFLRYGWKKIVQQSKERIAKAQGRNDAREVALLLGQLQEVKKKLLDGSF